MKKLLFVLPLALLFACSDADNATPPSPQIDDEQVVTNIDVATESPQTEEEPSGIQSETLLENAPALPTNVEEIFAYPIGPFSGNSYYDQLDGTNTLTTEQLAENILTTLPAFTAEDLEDPTFLDKWFNGLYSLIAEDYRNPQGFLDDFAFEAFGKLMINGQPIQFNDELNILFVLDGSGSMANSLNGETMLQIAQNELNALVDRLPAEVNIGLRVYGGEQTTAGDSCAATELVEPIARNNKQQIKTALNAVTPSGWTPIAASLKEATNDFAQFSGEAHTNIIYLISDGMETCDGNPLQEVQNLLASPIKPIVNVVGFNVDASGQAQLEQIAQQGNGQYVHAANKQAFTDSLKSIEKIVQAWEKRKLDLQEDALTARGILDNEFYNLSKEWEDNIKNEYDALMLVMDTLNTSTDYFEDPQIYSQVQSALLDKISAKNDVYRTALDTKHEELMADLDATYEGIIENLK